MIYVRNNGNGTYCEQVPGESIEPGDSGVIWVRDSYTEPREYLFECADCNEDITDWDLWTCLDGGEAAHLSCIQVTGKDLESR